MLDQLDEKNVGQFGRSGGWLSICKEDFLDFSGCHHSDVAHYLRDAYKAEDNKAFNEAINDIFRNKAEAIRELKSVLKEFEDKKAVVDWVHETIQRWKKGFKTGVLDRLADEISQFVEDNLSIDVAVKLADSGNYSKIDEIVEVNDLWVITNRKAKVPKRAAVALVQCVVKGIDVSRKTVGAFTVNKVVKTEKDTYVKIGCHLFSLTKSLTQLSCLSLNNS